MISQEEYNAIEEVRATCHGLSAAIALALRPDPFLEINMHYLRERLQFCNRTLANILNKYPELYEEWKMAKAGADRTGGSG